MDGERHGRVAVEAVVKLVLVPRELSENTWIACCCVDAFGKVKMPTVSEALLVALIVKFCVWHTFKEYVEPGVVEVKDDGRN